MKDNISVNLLFSQDLNTGPVMGDPGDHIFRGAFEIDAGGVILGMIFQHSVKLDAGL